MVHAHVTQVTAKCEKTTVYREQVTT